MKLYTATIANQFYYTECATMAPDLATATKRFEAYSASEAFTKAADEERAMWVENEYDPYPGDEAYTYGVDGIEEDRLTRVTGEYLSEIEADTTGSVFFLRSGSNG